MKKKKQNKMQGRRLSAWKIVLICAFVLLLVIFAGAYAFLELYRPSVDVDGPYISEQDESNTFSLNYYSPARKYSMVEALGRFKVNVISGVHKKTADDDFTRREGVYNFLVMGHDKVALNTDVIMIVSYDVNNGKISLVQIPRDTYIEYNGYPNKINSTMAYMYNKAYREGKDDLYHTALSDTATLLEKILNIQIDNYVLVNLDAFSSIVDIIGGVPLDVPADMDYDDIYQNLSIHIKKGYQVLDGKTAAEFIRFRSGYIQADIGRQDAQKLFMTAFIKQFKQNMTVDKLPKIVEQMYKNVTTDISLSDMIYYAKSLLAVDLENISMMTVPGAGINTFGGSYYVVYRKNVLEIINQYFNVYKSDITDPLFDQDRLLTNENSEDINSLYLSDNGKINISDGESILQNGIYIPRVYYTPKPELTEEATEDMGDITEDDSADIAQSGDTEEDTSAVDTDQLLEEDTNIELDLFESDDTEETETSGEGVFETEEENTEQSDEAVEVETEAESNEAE